MINTKRLLSLLLVTFFGVPSIAGATVKVVTTLTDYAAIARDVGGDRVEVQAIVAGNADGDAGAGNRGDLFSFLDLHVENHRARQRFGKSVPGADK